MEAAEGLARPRHIQIEYGRHSTWTARLRQRSVSNR